MPATPLNAVPVSDELDELDSRVRTIGIEPDSDAHLLLKADPRALEHAEIVLAERYRLVRHLDRGATADVYLAEDTLDGSEVVAKILDEKATATEDLRSRFVVGARAAMRIRHPNVVRIYEAEAPAGRSPYSIMEVLEGETLGHLFRRGDPLPSKTALRLSRQLAAGLHAVHEAGIIHRDVKPDNIFLVGPLGSPKIAKILDFGLAKCDPQREENVVLGTGQYMAPEQVLGDRVDARSDVYSLGVVMFRMFTDHLPWDLELGVELLRHHLVSPAPPPSWLNEALDPRIEVVILRALCKHPENRFASMQELVDALDAILESTPSVEPPVAYRPSRLPDLYTPCTAHARENAALLNVPIG
ncbi:MAG: serine/threonine-protein kinase [Polyangiaceae bacterium]|nr:serine/threonine-protein kinase [Polyangiaceae bacterium]